MVAVSVTTASLIAADGISPPTAPAAAADKIIAFTVRRTEATLSNIPQVLPALGTTFIASLQILDEADTAIGDGSALGAIVGIVAGIPPKLVTQINVIFRLPEGEIHTSNMHTLVIPNPGVQHPIAVTGGTGAYRTARGSGTFEHFNDTDTRVILSVTVDPPAKP